MDIGESIVGAYMRYVRGCEVVVYNTFLRDRQGEIDVVALKTGPPREVWLCEVTTHIGGMLYPAGGADGTLGKLRAKLQRAREFAEVTFPEDPHRFEIWSPRVAVGKLTEAFEALEAEVKEAGMDLDFVINEEYTRNLRRLAEHARSNSSATSEPAYRMLQVLTHLRAGNFDL